MVHDSTCCGPRWNKRWKSQSSIQTPTSIARLSKSKFNYLLFRNMQENLTRDAPEINGCTPVKKCRFCQFIIPETAIKCNGCGEFQDIKYKWKWVPVKPALFQKVFCTHCFETSKPRTITKWSILIEMIMWLAIIPGIFYSSYRQKSKTCVCRLCGSDRINKI